MSLFLKNHKATVMRSFVIGSLVLLQVVLVIFIARILKVHAGGFYVFLQVISVFVMLYLFQKQASDAYKFAWLFVVMLLGVAGFILYLMWGNPRFGDDSKVKMEKMCEKSRQLQKKENRFDVVDSSFCNDQMRLASYLNSQGFVLYSRTLISYFSSGEKAFESIKEDLKQAKKFIFMEFYILSEGRLWDEIKEILFEKSRSGVDVWILFDDWGSLFSVSDGFCEMLEEQGIKVKIFNPVQKRVWQLYMNYRNHQKIVVIDGKIAYTGGINLADEYVNYKTKHGHWKDLAVRLKGSGASAFLHIFLEMWQVQEEEQKVWLDQETNSGNFQKEEVLCAEREYCQPFFDGPFSNPAHLAKDIFLQIIHQAKEKLYLMTPYLAVDAEIINALTLAAKSGVDVRIMTPGIPDHRYVSMITRYQYGELLKERVKIFEYAPGFLHGKMIVNENCGVIGTVNMDYRSFYLQYECGTVIYGKNVIEQMVEDFLFTQEKCHPVFYEDWKARPLAEKLTQPLLNLFAGLF